MNSYRRAIYAWYQFQSVVKSTLIDRRNLIISVKILQVCDCHPYGGWHAWSLSGLLPYWKASQHDIRTLTRGPCCSGALQSTWGHLYTGVRGRISSLWEEKTNHGCGSWQWHPQPEGGRAWRIESARYPLVHRAGCPLLTQNLCYLRKYTSVMSEREEPPPHSLSTARGLCSLSLLHLVLRV